MQVYKREDIPTDWHNSDHRRIPPLFLASDPGWIITDSRIAGTPGRHGYDTNMTDMWSTFLAQGPSFHNNATVSGFHSVDVYQVMCHVTSVECHAHNGSWTSVCDLFLEDMCEDI